MPRDPEHAVRQAVSASKLMEYTRNIARWVRSSGSEPEARAFDYLETTLREFGLDVHREQHDALISWPGKASLEVAGAPVRHVECITHAFSAPTAPDGLEGEVVDLGAGESGGRQLRGKIGLMDGLAMPTAARTAEEAGLAGVIFINPPELHEMIISTVWGSPTPETFGRLPKVTAVSVREHDGAVLRARAREGDLRVRIHAEVDTRWRETPILIADLPGREDPARYVLFSGHVDSWHYGAMDNGSANAVMLETARVLSKRRARLRRGVRYAFWSGHSHGRYSGSTWYADHHWEDLYRNAVLHLNVDSSGAKGASVMDDSQTMAETWASAAAAIQDVAGQALTRPRISRMGDQSFWGIGVPSMFGGVSAQPAGESPTGAALAQLHGGPRKSGGLGWWWHTTDDTLDKIDRANLKRDAEVYVLVLWRWCSAPLLPLDYRAAAGELRETLRTIQETAGDAFDLAAPLAAVTRLSDAVDRLHASAERLGASLGNGRGTRRLRGAASLVNDTLMRTGRALIPINYTSAGAFDHDLAVPIPPIPVLQSAAQLRGLSRGTDEYHVLETRLVRERNKVTHTIDAAADAIGHALKHVERDK
jgi:hypothetical protein